MRRRPTVAAIDPHLAPAAGGAAGDVWSSGCVTVREAVAEFGLSRDQLFDLMRDGALAWRMPGKARLIARASLARWLASHPSGGG